MRGVHLIAGINFELRSKTQLLPEATNEVDRLGACSRGGAQQKPGSALRIERGEIAGFCCDGNALLRAIRARCEVGDGKARCWRSQHGTRRRHAVEQAEDLEL